MSTQNAAIFYDIENLINGIDGLQMRRSLVDWLSFKKRTLCWNLNSSFSYNIVFVSTQVKKK